MKYSILYEIKNSVNEYELEAENEEKAKEKLKRIITEGKIKIRDIKIV